MTVGDRVLRPELRNALDYDLTPEDAAIYARAYRRGRFSSLVAMLRGDWRDMLAIARGGYALGELEKGDFEPDALADTRTTAIYSGTPAAPKGVTA